MSKFQFFALKRRKTGYNSGFTLVELLISISIFMFLGIMLVSVFKSAMELWHTGEAQKIIFTRARNILDVVREDLYSMYRHDYFRDNGEPVDIKFVSDFVEDPTKNYFSQRIRFVRNIPGEMQDTVMRDAGTYGIANPVDTIKHYDQFDDSTDRDNGVLAAPGGLMEVGYLLSGETLYRAQKAPVGLRTKQSSGSVEQVSLFNGDLFFKLDNTILNANARIMGLNILHFEIRFWAPDSTSWDITEAGRLVNEAIHEWDSTRVESNAYTFAFDDAAAVTGDPEDDIYPPKVKVILVVDANQRTRAMAKFMQISGSTIEVNTTQGFIKNDPARQFIKIGTEWIKYSAADGNSFTIEKRGVRHTSPITPTAGQAVYQGRLFEMVIDVPGVKN